MNRQSLKQVQILLDDLMAAMRYQKALEVPASLVTIDVWVSTLGTAQTELKEFEKSLSLVFENDVRGVNYGYYSE